MVLAAASRSRTLCAFVLLRMSLQARVARHDSLCYLFGSIGENMDPKLDVFALLGVCALPSSPSACEGCAASLHLGGRALCAALRASRIPCALAANCTLFCVAASLMSSACCWLAALVRSVAVLCDSQYSVEVVTNGQVLHEYGLGCGPDKQSMIWGGSRVAKPLCLLSLARNAVRFLHLSFAHFASVL